MKTKHYFFLLLAISGYLNLLSQQSWTQKLNLPDSRYEGIGFSIGNDIYYGLGENAGLGGADNKIYKYTPATNTWTTVAPFPGTARRLASAFSVNGKGYVGFGVDPGTTLELKDLWEYNPITNSWAQKASLPVSYGWLSGTAIGVGNKGYAGLGTHDHSTGFRNLTWWEYDPTMDSWTQKADFPDANGLYLTNCFTTNNSIYVLCGIGGPLALPSLSVWQYNITQNSWTQKNDFPGSSRTNISAFSINGIGYAGTGNNGSSNIADFYSYNFNNDTWTSVVNPGSAYFDASCATTTKGYGINNGQELWEFSPSSVSIKEYANTSLITLSPNPTESFIKISGLTINDRAEINVHDIYGQTLITETEKLFIDLSSYRSGIYMISIKLNNELYNYKIIKN